MIWYLIKNNLKLMFRNKAILATMVLGPIFVIAMLSSAFDDLMKSYEKAGKFKAGYQVEGGVFGKIIWKPLRKRERSQE